jgi:putative acetyltransferase
MLISPVVAADVPEVIALVTASLEEFGLRFGVGSATDADVSRLPASYTERGGRFWVARDHDGRLLGTAGLMPLEDPALLELRKMYLAPSARGRGVGRALLDEALGFARASGAARVVLDTTDAMKRAIAFYERAGFVRDDSQVRGSRCSRGYRLELGPTHRS